MRAGRTARVSPQDGAKRRFDMTRIATLTAALGIATAAITPAFSEGAPICLQSTRIDHTSVVNARTLMFHMKDGTVYRNDLHGSCIGLKFNGFSYVLHG